MALGERGQPSEDEVVYEAGPETERPAESPPETSCFLAESDGHFPGNVLVSAPRHDSETNKEKFNRLKSELYFLHEQIDLERQESAATESEPVDDVRQLLTSLQKCARSATTQSTGSEGMKLALLENKIGALEKRLGLDCPQKLPQPLSKLLEDIEVRLRVLSPGFLAGVQAELAESNKTSAFAGGALAAAVGESQALSREDRNSLAEVDELVRRWDDRCKEVPALLDTLQTSQAMAADVERTVRKYDELLSLKKAVHESIAFHLEHVRMDSQRNRERLQLLQRRISQLKE